MYVLRCTQVVLGKLSLPRAEISDSDAAISSTRLGDWYVNRLNVGRLRLLICTSEASLLSVVLPARDLPDFPARLVSSLAELLRALEMPTAAIATELDHMSEFRFGRTRSRRVLGSMNDLAWQAEVHLRQHPRTSLLEINLDLADVPCSPLAYKHPGARTRELLSALDTESPVGEN